MNDTLSSIDRRFIIGSYLLIGTTVAIVLSVLIGWQFDIAYFMSGAHGFPPMNPLTAICFLVACTSVYLIKENKSIKLGRLLGLAVGLIGIVVMIQYSMVELPKIDMILFSQELNNQSLATLSTRMAINSAIGFVVLGLSQVGNQLSEKVKVYTEYLTVLLLFFSLLSLMGYIYQVDFNFPLLVNLPMAPHTALCFLLVSLAVLFAYPNRGLMSQITSSYSGGKLARRIFPLMILIPVLLGFLFLFSPLRYDFGIEFAEVFYTLTLILLFLTISWRIILALNKSDQANVEANLSLSEYNEELSAQAQQLKMTNSDLESFSYSVSHDLRAPLRSISGYAQILNEDYGDVLDEKGKGVIKIIIRNGEKMGRLIDDLLHFSKLGRKSLSFSDVDMHQLVNRVVFDINIDQPNKAKIEIESLPTARCDYEMIRLVFQNLISNAIKYSSKLESPSVKIGSYNDGEHVVYFIKDNGVGFDTKYLGKLFGVFQRLHKDVEFPGTGVGLAIVDRIVKKHHGRVWAESILNKGATFYFFLTENGEESIAL